MAVTNIRKDDLVEVIAGSESVTKKRGKVLKVNKEKNRAVVEKVNVVKRHMRPSQLSQGGIVEKEATIHLSNIALVCQKCDRGVRVGIKVLDDGTKVRVCKKCGEVIDK
ncbi:MAG: 50S ribosomal protein L24 [Deltaproteobacteria bacterium]|nr:MAG: 50S ribosomal protein L24 [Deltaproteobacteria bacterium]